MQLDFIASMVGMSCNIRLELPWFPRAYEVSLLYDVWLDGDSDKFDPAFKAVVTKFSALYDPRLVLLALESI